MKPQNIWFYFTIIFNTSRTTEWWWWRSVNCTHMYIYQGWIKKRKRTQKKRSMILKLHGSSFNFFSFENLYFEKPREDIW